MIEQWEVDALAPPSAAPTRDGPGPVTLGFHDVVAADPDASGFPGPTAARYKFDQEMFRVHLDAVRATVDTRPLRADAIDGGAPAPRWLLTFDDGGVSAVGIGTELASRGWVGNFFVTSDRIGTPGFLAAEEIRGLHAAGHVIGSHSCSHPERMSRCSDRELAHEWGDSVERLAGILGSPVTVASVPGGYSSARVVRAAAAAGIRTLFTSRPATRVHRVAGCAVLGRFALRAHDGPATSVHLVTRRLLPRLGANVAWNLRAAAKGVGGNTYLQVRRALLARGS